MQICHNWRCFAPVFCHTGTSFATNTSSFLDEQQEDTGGSESVKTDRLTNKCKNLYQSSLCQSSLLFDILLININMTQPAFVWYLFTSKSFFMSCFSCFIHPLYILPHFLHLFASGCFVCVLRPITIAPEWSWQWSHLWSSPNFITSRPREQHG